MESIQKNGFWGNILMGISGGIVPCPSALVILLLAISLKMLAFGLLLIVFFSIGLAATLTLLGILFSRGTAFAGRYDRSGIIAHLPIVSAGLITLLGILMLVKSARVVW